MFVPLRDSVRHRDRRRVELGTSGIGVDAEQISGSGLTRGQLGQPDAQLIDGSVAGQCLDPGGQSIPGRRQVLPALIQITRDGEIENTAGRQGCR